MNKLSVIIVIAGLSLPASAQLPPIDAGTILNQIQHSQPQFPAIPPPTTLDMCVFSQFKNNKCIFKCESGAVLTEPAMKPDFSTGEPAGACATHILRPVPYSPYGMKMLNSSDLRDLLRDSNPEVRKAAVKASRGHIHNSYAQDPVRDILENSSERLDIRIEAARVLSYATGNSRVQDALRDIIRQGNEPRALRVMAYKALWSAAGSHSRIQDFLTDAVKYEEKDPEARRAAIWALFDSVRNSRPQDLLVDLLRYGSESDAVKIEAIKSLYSAAGNSRVKDQLTEIVKYKRESKPVQLAAIKALSAANGDSRVRDLLEDIMERDSDVELRTAAIEAASPDMSVMREYFHLGYKLENGGYVSPIEKE